MIELVYSDMEEEQGLLLLLANGFSDHMIARHLCVSLRTVERRVAKLHALLGAKTRFQLAVLALRGGLIKPGELDGPCPSSNQARKGSNRPLECVCNM
ncbi:response regulator transcription factor [Streptosporangium sp. NPDC000396]|uniref:response regulator transcription factor n=1 Tax=Streptosporangium sp. NPDC000396 TaxID=3366185 RepID=UPI0036C2E576